MACDASTLLTQAAANGYYDLDDRSLKIAILQLLCSGQGTGAMGLSYFISGNPNGVQTATRPAIAYDDSGRLWVKTGAGTTNTGWEQMIGPPP